MSTLDLPGTSGAYAHRIFDDHVIIRKDDKYFSCDYDINEDGEIELGESEEVKLEFVAAEGRRNSDVDQKRIQTMHDHSVALGATCSASNIKALEEVDHNDAAEGGGGGSMSKEERAAAITALIACPCSGFTAAHSKMLEAATDEQVLAFKALGEQRKADQDKAAAELKTAQDAKAAAEQAAEGLRAAAAKPKTEDEYLKDAPESIRALVADKKAQDAKAKDELVAVLKVASNALTEEQLKAKSLDELKVLASFAKVEVPDYSGRGLQGVAPKTEETYTPPNPYAEGLRVMQGGKS
jgi:hypothetical protein